MEIVLTNDNFEQEVLKSDIPVLVDFFATWCGPCKMMMPLVEQVATDYEGKMKVATLDIDEVMELADEYNVMSVPTFKLFKGGEVAATFVGVMSDADFRTKIDENL